MANYIYTNDGLISTDELAHYGVPGMKWGVRRDSKLAPLRRQARLAYTTDKLLNDSRRYTDRLSKKKYPDVKTQLKIKKQKEYEKKLSKLKKTLMRDLTLEDLDKGRKSINARTLAISGLIGPVAGGIYNAALITEVEKLMKK